MAELSAKPDRKRHTACDCTRRNLCEILEHTRAVLLDFDGPICAVFGGYPSTNTADRLRQELKSLGVPIPGLFPTRDPLAVLGMDGIPDSVRRNLESLVQAGEMRAAEFAVPTTGTDEFLSACQRRGLPVVIVTNNSPGAVQRYLDRLNIQELVKAVFARDPGDPSRMKPDPYLVDQAVGYLGLPAGACVLIGDSSTDVAAAHAAGVRSIGYANKPGKRDRLQAAGADAVVCTMGELAAAVAGAVRHRSGSWDYPAPSLR
ncbi:MAG: HAD family hydrolase [Dactylosporangium sp.]|nr:HAD family hydrolase [Dactylosporangium sp.]NNJ63546.1 HAD family hydrolase [Dactylosporangium sp.]